jgi:hypothetical protein
MIRNVLPRLTANNMIDVATRDTESVCESKPRGQSPVKQVANIADLGFIQFGGFEVRTALVVNLMTSAAERFKVTRLIVRSIRVAMMNDQSRRRSAPFTRVFQMLPVVTRAASTFPLWIVRAARQDAKTSLTARLVAVHAATINQVRRAAYWTRSLRASVYAPAVGNTKAFAGAIMSGFRWDYREGFAAGSAGTLFRHRSLSLRCHAGGCRKHRSRTSFVPRIIPNRVDL